MEFNNTLLLIVLSSIVLISHVFNLISKISRIPSVLLLIAFGIALKQASVTWGINILDTGKYLELLGTIGLILIVLEGSADLKLKRENLSIIRSSFSAAAAILLLATSAIALLLHAWLNVDLRSAIVNAIPLGVISSAIAIPTVAGFTSVKKEFLIYESVFSDILGIMFFNFMITPRVIDLAMGMDFIWQLLIVAAVSLGGSFVLLQCLYKMKTTTRFFIILAMLMLFYGFGKMFHLPILMLVFTFGILLNNSTFLFHIKAGRDVSEQAIERDLEQFKLLVGESAFVIRTFFFVIFGYTMNMVNVLNWDVVKIGTPIVIILFLVRFVYLKYVIRSHVFPEIFISPKGLVTILLFYSIPSTYTMAVFNEGGVVFFVILVTNLLMLLSGFSHKHLSVNERQ